MGYTLTLERNNNSDPIVPTAGVDSAKMVIEDNGWYVPHYTTSLENQQIMMDQLLNKDPTELYYKERILFTKDANTNNTRTFDFLGKVENQHQVL